VLPQPEVVPGTVIIKALIPGALLRIYRRIEAEIRHELK